jgi:hypothetical protein
MNLPNLANLHRNISADVWPNGATLACSTCGYFEQITSAQAGQYLAKGWPTHCGATMSCNATPL